MMLINNFSLFLSITFIVSASPGPVMLSCMSHGARYGMKKAFSGMLGASLGNIFLVGLSALGLGFIISSNDTLFTLIKWFGAAYLLFMGLHIIRKPVVETTETQTISAHNHHSVFLNLFIIAASNPKGLIYFGALFPQFISYHAPLAPQFFILTCTFLITDMGWMTAYAAAGKKIMHWLKTPQHQKRFNIASGIVLMAAGLFMAFSGKS